MTDAYTVAVHEAGHAFMAFTEAVEVKYIELRTDPDNPGLVGPHRVVQVEC